MGKISDRQELLNVQKTDMLGVYRPGIPNVDYKISVQNLLGLLNQTVIIPDMEIDHVNGVLDNYVGVGTPISSAHGVALVSGALSLTPASNYWRSENKIASGIKMKVYTNIVANDCVDDFDVNNNGIVAYMVQVYQDSANSATQGQRSTVGFYKTAGAVNSYGVDISYAVNGGVLNNPPEIGDVGTFYGECDINNIGNSDITNQIGLGGAFSRYYYTFGIQIAPVVVTKNFKFRFELEYI